MGSSEISVTRVADEDPAWRFRVQVADERSTTTHDVTLSREDFDRLRAGRATPEDLVRDSFAFLLEREPKESILPSFDVRVIGRYFPGFEAEIARG